MSREDAAISLSMSLYCPDTHSHWQHPVSPESSGCVLRWNSAGFRVSTRRAWHMYDWVSWGPDSPGRPRLPFEPELALNPDKWKPCSKKHTQPRNWSHSSSFVLLPRMSQPFMWEMMLQKERGEPIESILHVCYCVFYFEPFHLIFSIVPTSLLKSPSVHLGNKLEGSQKRIA